MRNLFKKCTLIAAVLGATMFHGACLNGNWWLWSSILNEELFG